MGILAVIGVIYIIFKLIEEATEPTCPPGKEVDWEKMNQDFKIGDTKGNYKKYRQGIKNGKYLK